jgi:hypothetical protein
MGDLSDFQSVQIVGARLAGASVTETAALLGVLRAVFCKGYDDMHIMAGHHQLTGTVVENQN